MTELNEREKCSIVKDFPRVILLGNYDPIYWRLFRNKESRD